MYNSSFEVFGQNDSAPCRRSQGTILFKISIFSVCVNLCWTWNVSFSRMPICSCGFTIRGILSAIQFLYVIVDKLCDIFIICTTKGYGFVDLHLFLKLVVFFACIGVGERKVILFIMLYYWHQNLVFLTYMLSNWSSSIPFVFFCMIKSMQNVKRRGESRYFFFTPVHSIVLFHKYFLAFKSVNTILIDLRHEYPRFQNDREYFIYG